MEPDVSSETSNLAHDGYGIPEDELELEDVGPDRYERMRDILKYLALRGISTMVELAGVYSRDQDLWRIDMDVYCKKGYIKRHSIDVFYPARFSLTDKGKQLLEDM